MNNFKKFIYKKLRDIYKKEAWERGRPRVYQKQKGWFATWSLKKLGCVDDSSENVYKWNGKEWRRF